MMVIVVIFINITANAIINVSPVYIEFTHKQNAVEVILENYGNTEKVFSASIKQWNQVNGEDIYSHTDEVLVLPAMRKLLPHSQQKFRVIWRKKTDGNLLKSFRLFFYEVPSYKNISLKTALAITFQFVVPVFVYEKNYQLNRNISWTGEYDAKNKKITLKLINQGNNFIKLGKLNIPEVKQLIDNTWRYLLPHNEKIWQIHAANLDDNKLSLNFVEIIAQKPAKQSAIVHFVNNKNKKL